MGTTGVCPMCGVPFDDAHTLPAPGALSQRPECMTPTHKLAKDWKSKP